MRAWLSLRNDLHYRRDAFTSGLEACGYDVHPTLTEHPGPQDILIVWNRYGAGDACAKLFEKRGLPVLVAENGYLGNDFAGSRWYALSRTQHNGAGHWPDGGPERWDSLGVTLAPWRTEGEEVVILPQRGIGPAGIAMPRNWADVARSFTGGRVRPHPGKNPAKPLADDLAKARCVVTWGSGAALKALAMGIPVFHAMRQWIGAEAAAPMSEFGAPKRNDEARLACFRRMAWAMWRLPEIADGTAFKRLLAA